MSSRKSERIMNLTICLLMTRRFVEREQIRDIVVGYQGLSDAAFERTFERDKDELRALGVPVETGSNSSLFPDEVGYRIRRTDFELPPLEFDAAETAALGLAATVWDEARLAEDAVRAVAKLRAVGVEPDTSRTSVLAASMGAQEPAFEPLWRAWLTRTRVTFRYRDRDRIVEPWAMTYRIGSWYLLGFDRTRGEERLFKLSRVQNIPALRGRAGAYQVPEGDLGARFAALEPEPGHRQATIAVLPGTAAALIRHAQPAPGTAVPAGFVAYQVPLSDQDDTVGRIAEHGSDVVVLAPAELREAVVAHLRAIAKEDQ